MMSIIRFARRPQGCSNRFASAAAQKLRGVGVVSAQLLRVTTQEITECYSKLTMAHTLRREIPRDRCLAGPCCKALNHDPILSGNNWKKTEPEGHIALSSLWRSFLWL